MPRCPASGSFTTLLLALCGVLSVSAAPPDVAVTGALPNGVRYVIVPHSSPRNDLSLRLVMGAGWFDEREGERSFAHLVEHLGFAGTRSHPGGTLPRYLETLGLSWGADLNARTLPTHTIYLLDFPRGKTNGLEAGLVVLREFVDGLEFAPDAVAREAAIVGSELRARDNVVSRVNQQVRDRLYATVRTPEPAAKVVIEQIARATPGALRAFQERHYRADRATVLVVGPVVPEEVVAKLTAAFGSLATPAEPGPARPPVVPASGAKLPVDFIREATFKAAVVELVAIQPRPAADEAGRRKARLQEIARAAFDARLIATLTASGIAGSVRLSETAGLGPDVMETHLQVQTAATQWFEGVNFAENELRRLREFGLLPTEVTEAVSTLRAARRSAAAAFAGLSSSEVVKRVEHAVLEGRSWRSPDEERAEFEAAVKGLSAEEVSAVAREMFAEEKLRLVLVTAEKIPGGADEVRTVFERSARRRLSAPVATPPMTFYYTSFGAPGTVTSRERDEDLGLERLGFANGVRLNVRPSSFEPDRFQLEVAFRQNAAAVPKNRPGLGEVAAAMVTSANTGKHVEGEIKRLLAQHSVTLEFDTAHGAARLRLAGPSRELGFALRLVAALLSDLQPDPAMFRANLGRYVGVRESWMRDASRRAMRELELALAGNDARLRLPEVDRVSGYGFDEVKSWVETWWLKAPVDLGLVGDFAPEVAVMEVAATVGALPPRIAPHAPRPLELARGGGRHTFSTGVPGGAASVAVAWPLTADEPRANAALQLAVDVLRDRLMLRLREQLGATYSPMCGWQRDRLQREFGYAWMLQTFKPEQAGQFTDQALAIATQLARDGVTAEEFARLREPARAQAAEELVDDRWWLRAVVTPAQLQPAVLAMARQRGHVVDDLTIDDVNRAARLFATPPTIVVVRPGR